MRARPGRPMIAPSTRPPTANPLRRARSWGLLLGALALATVGWWLWQGPPGPARPIPAPPQLGSLDPQVRAHLIQCARQAAEAPFAPERRAELGLALAVNGLWPEARQCFLDAAELGGQPGEPWPPLYAAVSLEELGDPEGAARELRALVARFPSCAPAWHRLGIRAIALGDLKLAAQAFESVTNLAPLEWRGWTGLGEVRIRSGEPAAALPLLERALALDPYARSARHLLAQALQATGRVADAERERSAGASESLSPMPDAWSERALRHLKSLPDQFDRADALLSREQPEAAAQLLEEARRFHPTNSMVLSRLAVALTALERAPEAWALLEPHLAASSNDVPLLLAASRTAAALSRSADALAIARRALGLAPKMADARVAEANALLAENQDERAEAALQQAVELAPRNVGLLVQLGDLQWQNLDQPARARRTFERAYPLDPINAGVLQRLVSINLQLGDLATAESRLAEWQRLAPEPAAFTALQTQLQQARHRLTP